MSVLKYEDIKIECIYCEKTNTDYSGWDSLCDRKCYYGIVDLLTKYNTNEVSDPDPKIVKYFTINPEPTHSFFKDKILSYIIKNQK